MQKTHGAKKIGMTTDSIVVRWAPFALAIAVGSATGFLLARPKSTPTVGSDLTKASTLATPAPGSDGMRPVTGVAALPTIKPIDHNATTIDSPAANVVGTIFREIDATFDPGLSAEGNVVRSTEFIKGWVEAIRFSSSGLIAEIGSVFRRDLCDPISTPHRLFLIGRVLQMVPEAGSSEGFDCIFQKRPVVEDVVFWSVLDAWRISGLEPSAALNDVRTMVSDERTLRRINREGRENPRYPLTQNTATQRRK
ncbi:MAG TPA: hypothetical protein VGF45_13000 [Polyangia bacterium]